MSAGSGRVGGLESGTVLQNKARCSAFAVLQGRLVRALVVGVKETLWTHVALLIAFVNSVGPKLV